MANRVYNLIGYQRRKGNGKSGPYDFFEIYASYGSESAQADKGGEQIVYTYRNTKGIRLPCIDSSNFLDCLRSGLKIGGRISFSYDQQDHHLNMKVEQ